MSLAHCLHEHEQVEQVGLRPRASGLGVAGARGVGAFHEGGAARRAGHHQVAEVLAQPVHELGEVVAAPHEAVDERDEPGAVGLPGAVGDGEEHVLVHDAEGLAERADLEAHAAERDGLVEERERVAERAVALSAR